MDTTDQAPDHETRAKDARLRTEAAAAVAEVGARVAADPWRQSFHVQPVIGGLADPVGMVQHDGVYHLCHLWQPFAPERPLIFWVHLTSTDLVHWSEPTIAMAPSSALDSHGCYSGSAIVHDGLVRFLYTGNVRTPDGGRIPYQCLATLQPDGTVIKHPEPLFAQLPGYTPHLRDPNVWVADGSYVMALGAQTEDLHGTLLLLRSDDLVHWHVLGQAAGGNQAPMGYMWECPGVLRMVDRSTSQPQDVLIVSPQFDHGPQAGAGRFEDATSYTCGQLSVDPPRLTHGPFHQLDAGPDFYAPRAMVDEAGRAVVVGWMGMPVHPGEPTLESRHPTVANGWVHCLTVPRSLELVDGRLLQWPIPELDHLHGPPVEHPQVTVAPGQPITLPGVEGACVDLQFRGECPAGGTLVVGLREGTGQRTLLTIDPEAGSVHLDRTASGSGEPDTTRGAIDAGRAFSVRLLLDNSSVEVFVNGGRLAMSARIYPEPTATGISFAAEGGTATLTAMTCHPMRQVGSRG